MSATIMTSDRDQWTSPNHSLWSDFHHKYWGAGGRALLDETLERPPLERFLDIGPPSVQKWLGVFSVDDSFLLVRDEILVFAQRFRDARDLEQALDGVVLLGQSGIGKTVLLIFLLLQRLSLEEQVLFTTCYGETYLFDECGVVELTTSDFIASEHLPNRLDNAPRFWSLVDCPMDQAPPPLSVTLDARPQVFFVAALSPHKSRYKPFEAEPSVRTWWMSRWSDEELLALLRRAGPMLYINPEPGQRYRTFDTDTVRSLRATAGPVPRDILKLLIDPCYYNAVETKQMTYYCLLPTIALLSGTDSEAFSNENCSSITFVGRAGPGPLSPTELGDGDGDGDDAFVVGFKTRAAAQGAMDALERRPVEEIRALFERCRLRGRSNSSWATRGFADFLFESLARQYMCAAFDLGAGWDDAGAGGGVHALSALIDLGEPAAAGSPPSLPPGESAGFRHQFEFARMVFAPSSRSSGGTWRYVYRPEDADARRTTVVVDKTRRITWRPSDDSEHSPLPPPLGPAPALPTSSEPWAARRRVTFEDVEQLAVDGASYYCPAARTHPHAAFDAFFFQVVLESHKIVLWAVQVASKREDRADGGFEMVGRLRDRARRAVPEVPVEVKYVLVVPRDADVDAARGFNVEWELGGGFAEHEGEVYVQFLDVCGVCRVEDVFGARVPVPVPPVEL